MMYNALPINKKAKVAVLAVVVCLAFSDALSFCFYPKRRGGGMCCERLGGGGLPSVWWPPLPFPSHPESPRPRRVPHL